MTNTRKSLRAHIRCCTHRNQDLVPSCDKNINVTSEKNCETGGSGLVQASSDARLNEMLDAAGKSAMKLYEELQACGFGSGSGNSSAARVNSNSNVSTNGTSHEAMPPKECNKSGKKEKPGGFKCVVCDQTLTSSKRLENHYKIKHGNSKP